MDMYTFWLCLGLDLKLGIGIGLELCFEQGMELGQGYGLL
jgi:hypothetical protein